jgi:hypothetical protein
VRIGELGILSALAADCRDGTNLFEIGTVMAERRLTSR